MIDTGYPYGEFFQLRLLALLIRHPEKVSGIVRAEYFSNPMLSDIARITLDAYNGHPDARLTEVTLRELVRRSLGRKKEEFWPEYRKQVKKIYQIKFSDMTVLLEEARKFAKETRYRNALVRAERYITTGDYEMAHKTLEEARGSQEHLAQPKTGAAQLPVFHFHQLLATEFEGDGDYLVETLIPRGGAILSYGLPKGLKSWLSTAVALDAAIGNGKAVGHFDVSRPVRVLLVQVEDPASRTKSRLQRLWEARPLRQNPYPGNLRIVTRCPLNLLDPSWMARLEAVIAEQKTDLVIFDVFRRLFRGNVNSPEETAAFLEVVDALRDKYRVAIWIVHHSRKSGSEMMTQALGSINLTAWAEVLLYFKHKKVSDHITSCNLEIETKDQAIEGELKVMLADEEEPMLWVEEATPAQDKLQKAMSQLGSEWTVEELAKALDLKYAGAYRTLKEWIKQGIAVQVKPGAKGRRGRYRFAQVDAKQQK